MHPGKGISLLGHILTSPHPERYLPLPVPTRALPPSHSPAAPNPTFYVQAILRVRRGTHQVRWNSEGLSRGVYLVRMEVDGRQIGVQKMVRRQRGGQGSTVTHVF